MKILLFIDNLGAGGAQRQLVGLAVMLQQKGFTVKVCTYYPENFYKSYLDENGVPNEVIPGAANTKKRILAVRSYFKKEKPDCVIAYQETPSLVACACRVLGCKFKLIVSERNTTQHVGMNERVRFFLYRWADAIVPNSYSQEKWLIEHHPWMKKKITTISNFVDLEKFVPHKNGEKGVIPSILVAASIWASKNTIGLVEALNILKQKNLQVKVRWFGRSTLNQQYLDRCEDLIKQYGLQDYIELLDKTPRIADEYHKVDFFCLPSFYEGTPNVICEAIACGLPVLCSDVCDNARYVQDGVNGFLFDPHKAEEIAAAIEKAISMNEEEYASYSLNSRLLAEKLLDKNIFVQKYIDLIVSKQ